MTFNVYACWGGNSNYYFQVKDPRGDVVRFNVGHNRDCDRWCRAFAREAKDYLSYFYGLPRKNIRFALA
jgi:hypothetical protein